MSKAEGTWRSNYFTVCDPGAFKAWVDDIGADYKEMGDGRVTFFDVSGTGPFPGESADEAGFGGSPEFFAELHRLLDPAHDNVCVLMQIYRTADGTIVGKAFALRAQELGKPSFVGLDLFDIYDQAREAFGLKDDPEPV
jgi:hypothetical protein